MQFFRERAASYEYLSFFDFFNSLLKSAIDLPIVEKIHLFLWLKISDYA